MNKLLSILFLLGFFLSIPVHVDAQVQQLLPWPNGQNRAIYNMYTADLNGYTASCPDFHSDPILGKVDIGLSSTDQVVAAEGGKVMAKVTNCVIGDYNCNGGWGNGLEIKAADNRYNYYAHFSSLSDLYNLNDNVSTGQFLGTPGKTGVAGMPGRGVHLHFERWAGDNHNSGTQPLFYEATQQVFPNTAGRLVCGNYTSANNSCTPPAPPNTWLIDQSCTMVGNQVAPSNITISNDATLTIAPGSSLDVNFQTSFLHVSPGSRLIVSPTARIF